jgi:hypothetical protein
MFDLPILENPFVRPASDQLVNNRVVAGRRALRQNPSLVAGRTEQLARLATDSPKDF